MFIVNRNELVQQTGNAFGEMGLEREIGYIKSGFKGTLLDLNSENMYHAD